MTSVKTRVFTNPRLLTGILAISLVIIMLLINLPVQVHASNGDEPLRINAGGEAYTDNQGNVWNADQAYEEGVTSWGFYGDDRTVDRGTDIEIRDTLDDRIYQTERYRLSGYKFDLENGSYTSA